MFQFLISKLILSHFTCEDLQFTHSSCKRVDKTENLWYYEKKATLETQTLKKFVVVLFLILDEPTKHHVRDI